MDAIGTGAKRLHSTTLSNEPTKKKCLGLQHHHSPVYQRTPHKSATCFSLDASIVLVGFRGTGKSTLAVIASRAYQRRVIDVDQTFHDATGESGSSYRKRHGASQHGLLYLQIMTSLFEAYDKESILVCSMSSMEQNVQKYLQQYATTHPVIHVVRDSQSIQEYLSISDNARFQNILRAAEEVMRSCSSFEFYNAPSQLPPLPHHGDFHAEPPRAVATSHSARSSLPPFLALKNVETHFLKFLSLITPGATSHHMDHPLSSVPVHLRPWTYAASVRLSAFEDILDLDALTVGADAVEIVVDENYRECHDPKNIQRLNDFVKPVVKAFSRIRKSSNPLPILFHVDPAILTHDAICYFGFATSTTRGCPEYITFDIGQTSMLRGGMKHLKKLSATKKKTKIIGHVGAHDMEGRPWNDESLVEAYKRAQDVGCDLVRFTKKGESLDDTFAIHEFTRRLECLPGPKLPVIAYATHERGRTSACFNRILTAVTVSADQTNQSRAGFSVITAKSATQALYSSFVLDPLRFFIIGASANYSLSPAMHNAAYSALGLPHHYDIHQIPELEGVGIVIKDECFGGSSISQPFKVEIMDHLDDLSQHARAIGAVNTVLPVRRLSKDGKFPDVVELFAERSVAGPVKKLYGENTDWIGITACISNGLSPANAVGPSTTALIIGAGGMARAAVYALIHMGVRKIGIYNRTQANAGRLVDHFVEKSKDGTPPCTFFLLRSVDQPWPSHHSQPTIVVSCIPTHAVGDSPAPYFTLPQQWMGSKTGGVVLELGYKTLNTPLLQQIRASRRHNWVAMDGLDLLPEQGFAQFELFTGRRAPRRLMRYEVLNCYMQRMSENDEAFDLVKRRLLELESR
ncbi:quinate repressor [Phyllosticta citribraziliensis]|uniref:Quinate repressor n=1 Tax=Phyllosticta citribraziliensis TaxID=989973 RepID=A0ABR1L7J6_9PEZI